MININFSQLLINETQKHIDEVHNGDQTHFRILLNNECNNLQNTFKFNKNCHLFVQ